MSNKISGTVKSETRFLHQVFLPFANVVAANIQRDFTLSFASADVDSLYYATLDLSGSHTIDLTDLTNPLTNEDTAFDKVKYVHIVNTGEGTLTVGSPSTRATATATITGDAISAIAINSGGHGYTSAPLITISGNGTATATLTNGVVTTINITSGGSGYTYAPSIVIAAPTANPIFSPPIAAGGCIQLTNEFTITAATKNLILSGTTTVDIFIAGLSA